MFITKRKQTFSQNKKDFFFHIKKNSTLWFIVKRKNAKTSAVWSRMIEKSREEKKCVPDDEIAQKTDKKTWFYYESLISKIA